MSDKKRIDIFDEDNMPSPEDAQAQAANVPQEGVDEGLSERLAALEAELAAAREAHLRSVADLQNFRRRVNEERAVQLQFANEGLISEILPVLDNFERATGCEVDTDAARNLLRGVCMVEQQFRDILTRFGVQRIVTLGQFFDPAQHEAVERVVTEEVCEGTIVGEVEPGYALNGRVIRPARVKVAVAPH